MACWGWGGGGGGDDKATNGSHYTEEEKHQMALLGWSRDLLCSAGGRKITGSF